MMSNRMRLEDLGMFLQHIRNMPRNIQVSPFVYVLEAWKMLLNRNFEWTLQNLDLPKNTHLVASPQVIQVQLNINIVPDTTHL